MPVDSRLTLVMCNSFLSSAGGSSGIRVQGSRSAAINRLCGTLDDPANARIFLGTEAAYCLQFGLDRNARRAVRDRDFIALIQHGGQVAQLDKLAALSGLTTLAAIRMRRGMAFDELLAAVPDLPP